MRSSAVAPAGFGLPAVLREPDPGVGVRGGVVALHGSSLPQRDQPIFEHLATTVTSLGFAVLTFDRRRAPDGHDTPIDVQAADALTAVEFLRTRLDTPVGLYGFSQGAWSASLAVSLEPTVAFLVLVGCSGVSPAEQMRFYTDELLRRAGYGDSERDHLRELRLAVEALLRGGGDREATAGLLRDAVNQPWFGMAYLPSELPPVGDTWHDMDHDPEPIFSKVLCPTLLIYGADEECVPAAASQQIWMRAAQASGNSRIAIVELPGYGHFPAHGGDATSLDVPVTAFSSAYTDALRQWVAER